MEEMVAKIPNIHGCWRFHEHKGKVMFKKAADGDWISGKIKDTTPQPRSYLIIDDKGTIFRRNVSHISPRGTNPNTDDKALKREQDYENLPQEGKEEDITPSVQEREEDQEEEIVEKTTEENFIKNLSNLTTRSGRSIKPNKKFLSFVKKGNVVTYK